MRTLSVIAALNMAVDFSVGGLPVPAWVNYIGMALWLFIALSFIGASPTQLAEWFPSSQPKGRP